MFKSKVELPSNLQLKKITHLNFITEFTAFVI